MEPTSATQPEPRDSRPVAGEWRLPVLALAGLTLFARGLLIPWLGFYWDDLPTLWAVHLSGPRGLWQFYASDRPFLPWIYMLTTPLAGESPLAWQILGVLSWFVAALSMWWLVRKLWPARRDLALVAALLFVVYPGFLQGPVSIIYTHFLFLYGLFLFSLGCAALAIRRVKRFGFWYAASLGTQAVALFSFEYLVGLELVRPLVIAIALRQGGWRGKRLLRRVAVTWLPYLGILLLYVIWRAVTPRHPTYEPVLLEGLATFPWPTLQAVGNRLVTDLYLSTAGAWVKAIAPPAIAVIGRAGLAAMAAAFAGGLVVTLWALLSQRREAAGDPLLARRSDLLSAVAFGGWALVVAGIPVWITMLPLTLSYPWDRLTLPFMLGASILLAALLLLFIGHWRVSVVVFAVVLGVGASFHAANTMSYVREWRGLNAFLWQLVERIPGLEPGTVLLTNDIPLVYYSDNSLTAPLNWTYVPDLRTTKQPYMLYFISVRLGLGLKGLEPGLPIQQPDRERSFDGSTSQALAVFYNPPGCLQVLDVRLHDSMPGLPTGLSDAVPLSRLELIHASPESPAHPPFTDEPKPNWCIYFERADLARQQQDWAQVARIGDVALSGSDRPNDASEYLPIIEGYAHVSRWSDALQWSATALDRNAAVRRMICNTWKRLDAETPDDVDKAKALEEARRMASCEP